MRTRTVTTLLIAAVLAAGALVFEPHPPAAAETTPLTEPMHRLGVLSEDALHWLVRGDFAKLQHVSIELVRTTDLILGIAPGQGFAAQFVERLLDMREQAEKMGEEAQKQDLDDAVEEYLDMLETCMKCHVETR